MFITFTSFPNVEIVYLHTILTFFMLEYTRTLVSNKFGTKGETYFFDFIKDVWIATTRKKATSIIFTLIFIQLYYLHFWTLLVSNFQIYSKALDGFVMLRWTLPSSEEWSKLLRWGFSRDLQWFRTGWRCKMAKV